MPRTTSVCKQAQFKALLQNLPRSTRLKLTLAVALIFATLGPVITLAETWLTDRYLTQFFVITLFSASVAANIVWNMHQTRRMLVIAALIVAVFLGWLHFQASSSADAVLLQGGMTEATLETQKQRRSVLSLAGTLFISLGYAMFIKLVTREMLQRSQVETEIAVARDIQNALLPEPASHDGRCESYGVMRPATEVGGDYFDRFAISDQKTLYIVADIAGHGVGAGTLAAMFKSATWMELRHTTDLAALLRHLNQAFHALTDRRTFVTCAMLLLDTERREAILATAGHPPILHVNGAERTMTRLHTRGMALGLKTGADYAVTTRPYQPGDTFVLYTDGAFEAMNDQGEQFGEARLQQHVLQQANRSPRELCQFLLKSIQEFQQNVPPADDITILAVRCR